MARKPRMYVDVGYGVENMPGKFTWDEMEELQRQYDEYNQVLSQGFQGVIK
jgi:hypothetical protein